MTAYDVGERMGHTAVRYGVFHNWSDSSALVAVLASVAFVAFMIWRNRRRDTATARQRHSWTPPTGPRRN